MKNRLLLTLVLLASFFNEKMYSQALSPVSKFYLSGTVTGAPQKGEDAYGGALALNMVVRNKWALSLSYNNTHTNPSNLPKDFDGGHSEGFALIIPYSGPALNPMVHSQIISATAGRYFPLGKKSWFQLEAGPSLLIGEKAGFSRQAVTHTTINYLFGYDETTSANYSMTRTDKTGMGLMLKTDVQGSIGRFFALGIGITSEISSVQSMLLFELKFMAGNFGIPKKLKSKTKKS